ncbi:hypothetical protein AB0F81_01700 [Actinoplanes sp. NPDC024001]|uniref:hypothetical protein n=1 Tax=Actinoplanes sp. NPDC024001 TaxID=3154598 RepID=UPI0033E5D4F3
MAERPPPDLGAALRQEADRHVPDRAAMLSRIAERRTATRSRWAFTGLRPAAAAASVVATLVAGFTGIKMATDRSGGTEPPAATSVAPTTSPASPAAPAPSKRPSREPERADRPSRTPATSTPRWQPSDGFLSSATVVDSHSNETWAQENLTLTTTETITKLDLVISVARTAGVEDAGKWSSVPAEMITVTSVEEKTAVLYRFTLNEGRTLAPGQYVFAAQFLHAAGRRDTGADQYGAIAAAGSRKAEISGHW